MFDLLKKKITGLVGTIAKTISGEKENEPEKEGKQTEPLEKIEKIEEKKEVVELKEQTKETKPEKKEVREEAEEVKEIKNTKNDIEAQKRAQEAAEKKKTEITSMSQQTNHVFPKSDNSQNTKSNLEYTKFEPSLEVKETEKEGRSGQRESAKYKEIEVETNKIEESKERRETEIKVKTSLLTKVKSLIVPEVTIKESDVESALEDFELQLLTADVALPVAEEIISELRKKLVGKSVKSSEIENYILNSIYESIEGVIQQEKIDLVNEIKEYKKQTGKPYKILFIGPNGAGKTTTIAKVAHFLKKNGLKCVISASDTFRAAAIEQTIEHAKKLDIPFIKHDYGSDPAAVAFDAIKYAEAKGIDVVLIDSAGRQETNRNLIEQLKKIERVVSPNKKIFVGEGITGNALLTQVSEFNNAIKLDGVILTKLDVDAKGGTVISVKKATGVPIIFIGTGQEYDDLIPFDKDYIVKRIMSKNN